MISPIVLDPVPIVPKIDPSGLTIEHLILHHFSTNLVSHQFLY